MLQLIIEIFHLVLAGTMSLIGIDYSREAECDPVQVEPAAYYAQAQSPSGPVMVYLVAPDTPAAPQAVSYCGDSAAPARLPRPRLDIRA